MSSDHVLQKTISLDEFYNQLKNFSLVRISHFSQDESCAVCVWVSTANIQLVKKRNGSGEFSICCAYPSGAAHNGSFFFTIYGSSVLCSSTPGTITNNYQIHTHDTDYVFTAYH